MLPISPPRTCFQKVTDGIVLTGLLTGAFAAAFIPYRTLGGAVINSAIHAISVKYISIAKSFQHIQKPRTWLVITANLTCAGVGAASMELGGFSCFAAFSMFSFLVGLKITYIESELLQRRIDVQEPLVDRL